MKKILFCALIVCALPMTAAWGQNQFVSDDVEQRIERLERELEDLRAMAYGAASIDGTGPQQMVGDPSLSRVLVRLDQLEAEIRVLTGQIEELNFKVQQSSAELQSLSEDTDFRLQALENGSTPVAAQNSAPMVSERQTQSFSSSEQSFQSGTPLGVGTGTGDFKEQYDSALTHLKKGEHDQAEASLKQFVADHGDTELASNAQYWLGESYYVRQRYRDAAASFLEGVRKYPDGKKAPDSMLKLGMSLAALGQLKEACTTFTEIPRRYPNASQTIIQRSRNERVKAGCS